MERKRTLVTNNDLMVPARKNGYAIPALNVQNLESLTAVVEAAAEEKSPVILAITPSVIKYAEDYYRASAHVPQVSFLRRPKVKRLALPI